VDGSGKLAGGYLPNLWMILIPRRSLAGHFHFGYNTPACFGSLGDRSFKHLPAPTRNPLFEGKHEVRR
jgi:hypothetical protein